LELIFIGTADFGLPALEAVASHHNVKLTITQPDSPHGRGMTDYYSPVKNKSLELGIPVYQPNDINSPDSLKRARDLSVDAFVVVAYGQKISGQLLNLVEFPVNIHGSLLPKFRGAAPVNWAILSGAEKTGVTTMIMNEGMDTGPILLQEETEIGPNETAGKLHDRLTEMAGEAILSTLSGLSSGKISPTPQRGDPSYAPKLSKEDGRIDWTQPSNDVHNHIRGMYPWPGAYSFYDGQRVKICRSQNLGRLTQKLFDQLPLGKDVLDVKPGEIIDTRSVGFVVKCGNETAVKLTNVQPPSKCLMSGIDFVNGYQVELNGNFSETP